MKNNTKLIMLSILGMSLVLLAVLGTTFAFFTYSKTGRTNNMVAAGEMGLNLSESSQGIYLTNQFPMTNTEATTGIVSGGQDNVTSMTFTVSGYSSGTSTIPYTVYIIDGDLDETGKERFDDSEISVFISDYSTQINGEASGQTQEVLITTPTPVADIARDASGMRKVASGVIKAGTTELDPQSDTYVLKMLVNETVRISDTNLLVKMTGATDNGTGQGIAPKYCASDRTINNGIYKKGCKL